jgi:hypothetical protein
MPAILNISNSTKIVKSETVGQLTGIFYGAPSTVSGYDVCAFASAGCKIACLYSAGRGVFTTVQAARIRKTKMFFEDRPGFMTQVIKDVEALIRKAKREKLAPSVRMNGTSDIKWEKISCGCHKNLMEHFPELVWYDYTKIPIRYRQNLPANYSLTFSVNESNLPEALEALKLGTNIAVVFRLDDDGNLPEFFHGYRVIDGDKHDARYLDETGVVIGLKAKGDALKDTSGFVY